MTHNGTMAALQYVPYLPVPPAFPEPARGTLVSGSVVFWLLFFTPLSFGVTLVVLIVLACFDLAGWQPKRYHRAMAEWQAYEDHRQSVILQNHELHAVNEQVRTALALAQLDD